MQRTPRTRASTVATVLAALLLSTTGLVLADEHKAVKVSTSTEEGTRDLQVRNMANEPLTDLALVDGVQRTFRVAVVDARLNNQQQRGFDVNSTLNNLYVVDGEGHGPDYIPSGNVEVTYASDVVGLAGLLADVRPRYLLTLKDDVDCDLIDGAIDGTLEDLLSGLPLIGGTLDGLCDTLLGATLDEDIEVVGELLDDLLDIDLLDLLDLNLNHLPLVPSVGDVGTYDDADYDNGIGAGRGDGDPTVIRFLTGEENSNALTQLTSEIDGLLAGVPLVSEDGEALVSTEAVVDALLASGHEGLEALGGILDELGGSNLVAAILASVEEIELDLDLDDILALSGTYQSLPQLTVSTGEAPGGMYEGTLTITLMNRPNGQ